MKNSVLGLWLEIFNQKAENVSELVENDSKPSDFDVHDVKDIRKALVDVIRHVRLGWAMISEALKKEEVREVYDEDEYGDDEDGDDEDGDDDEPGKKVFWFTGEKRFENFTELVREQMFKLPSPLPLQDLLSRVIMSCKLKKRIDLKLSKGWQKRRNAHKLFVGAIYKLVGRPIADEDDMTFLLADLEKKTGRRIGPGVRS